MLAKRLILAVVAIAAGLALGFHFHSAPSATPQEAPKPHRITLTWNKTAGAASYIVYRRPYRHETYVKLTTSQAPAYDDPAVQSEERYCYQVTSVDSHGRESNPSHEMCVTVPQP